jgi:hypothetical protein
MAFVRSIVDAPVELRNGSVYLRAEPGETIEVSGRQFAIAMASGLFEEAGGVADVAAVNESAEARKGAAAEAMPAAATGRRKQVRG